MPPDSSCGRRSSASPEADHVEQLPGPLAALGAGHAAQPERELDVAAGGQPRQQGRVLEHQRHPPVGGAAIAGVGGVEPGDDVEQGALAAAGRADHGDELAVRDVEVHVGEGAHGALARVGRSWTPRRRSAAPDPLRSLLTRRRAEVASSSRGPTSGSPAAARTLFSSVRSYRRPGKPPASATLSSSSSPTATACSAEPCRVAGSGSAVNVTFVPRRGQHVGGQRRPGQGLQAGVGRLRRRPAGRPRSPPARRRARRGTPRPRPGAARGTRCAR